MVCHGELARGRPQISRLTEFYLWISVGGVLGGIFNSLLAPAIFSSVIEFPLVLIFAALLRPPIDVKPLPPAAAARAKNNDWRLPAALGLCMAGALAGLSHAGLRPGRTLDVLSVLIIGACMAWCLSFGKRPLRFAAGVAALLAASSFYTGHFGRVLDTERSFFGVLRVSNNPTGTLRYLFHGGTVHGIQSLNAADSREPLAYYTKSGPAGSIVRAMHATARGGTDGDVRPASWAVVGLGAGAMACYLQPGESLTYYEIDPSVKRIALDPHYFTFISQCAPTAKIVLGDARLKLRDAADGSYRLIVLDAFSGDTIPMHLMTKEALALYLRKLAPGGTLAFHISNRYLRLAPTFGALAHDAGLLCLMADDTVLTHAQFDAGKFASQWVVMARSRTDLGALATDAHWTPVEVPSGAQVWTDDYSNLLRIIKWN
jgi:SAM-dependent methyltransferase